MATYRSFGLIISAISALFGMLFMISTQALPVSSVPYFFRTNIMNPDGSTADRLVIGTTVDPVQNTSAVATQGGRTINLINSGSNYLDYSEPYNSAYLSPWTITATNEPDTSIKVTNDLFEVQVLPFVNNINVSGDLLMPTITWELPVTNVPYTNIKVRVFSFAGGAWIFDSDPLPINATTYTLPSGVLQSDQDYVLRIILAEVRDGVVINGEVRNGVLVNRSDRRVCYNTYTALLTISLPDVYYFRRAVRSTGAADRDEILLDAIKVTPSACTTVAARSLVNHNVNIPMNFAGGGIFPNEFAAVFPFNSVSPDVATGGFTITANNGGDQDHMTTHNIVGVQPLAFVENVNIAGNPLAPTVSWALPTDTAPFTRISVRVLELDANYSIIFNFGSPDLETTTTTYTIPDGVLKPNSDYSIRIRLQDVLPNGVLVNSSEVRVPYSTPCIQSVTASPNTLWPPNHKMVSVKVTANTLDNCTVAPVCTITSVSSNEPENGLGDGDTAPDWEIITGTSTAKLRAERSGTGTGRVYTVNVECADTAGNSAPWSTTVTVPHDQGRNR